MPPASLGQGANLDFLVAKISSRISAGEAIDLIELTAEAPELREHLEMLLPTLAAVAEFEHAFADPPSVAPPAASAERDAGAIALPRSHERGTLGDFRLIRELGRGGMGVVYEAEQISLSRRIALKVLPFAAVLDKQQLARFKNEARAAATLDHPNIVAVYSVGVERGVHHYAMQLVEGESLAQVIARLRSDRQLRYADGGLRKEEKAAATADFHSLDPSRDSAIRNPQSEIPTALSTFPAHESREYFRTVAQLGIQAAEALDYAHQNGILHRDVKPGNLLVDGAGKLWITDFGLARIEQDAGVTMTGDLIGTLRYMSPEQALAKRDIIDHRSDVYSLGVTLYELLTLEPAFAGDDRQELLRQIAFLEPARPRQLQPDVPRRLETIVLKAIRKDPKQRYPTAQELADDLKCFLNSQPIKARPVTLGERLVNWFRLHPELVLAVSAAVMLTAVLLALGVAMVKRAETRALAALEQTTDVLYAADMALAYQANEKGWADEAISLLNKYRPEEGKPDRRGFEWRLLNRLVQPPASFTLAGHRGPVSELAAFPDQRRLASVGEDGTLQIWDVRSKRRLKSISVCSEPLHSVAISPDGRHVAVGSTSVYLYDADEDGRPAEIYSSPHTVESLAFAPDGESIAMGSHYDDVCLLSLEGDLLKRIPSGSRNESLEFAPDGRRVLVPVRRPRPGQTHVGLIQIWDDRLSQVERELDATQEDTRGQITVARWSPSSQFVAAAELYLARAHLFDPASGRILASTPPGRDRICDLAVSPDEKMLSLVYQNGRCECYELNRDDQGRPGLEERPRVIRAHQGEIACVRFIGPSTVATCGADGQIRVWTLSVAGGAQSLDIAEGPIHANRLSPHGDLLACAALHEIVAVNSDTGEVVWRHGLPDETFGEMAWSPRDAIMAVGDVASKSVAILDGRGQAIASLPQDDYPKGIAFSPDGSLLAVIGYTELRLYRTGDWQRAWTRSTLDEGLSVAFSHDGALLAYGCQFHGVTILRLRDQQVLQQLPCDSYVPHLVFSPDDSILASGQGNSTIRLWDVSTGHLRAELAGHERNICSLAFSPDGRTLLSAAADSVVRAWSVDRGRGYGVVCRRATHGEISDTCRCSLSPDGRRLAVTYSPHHPGRPDVYLWNLAAAEGDEPPESPEPQ
jgi:serine/threonine protein kinase/WD40 repeat protein